MSALRGPASRLLTTARIALRPRQAIDDWLARYGDPCVLRTINGRSIITTDPGFIRGILAAPPDAFEQFGTAALRPLIGSESLMVLSGAAHKRDRKLLMPTLHGDRMRSYGEVIRDATRRRFNEATRRQQVQALHVTQQISLDIIVRAVFGAQDQQAADHLVGSISRMMDSIGMLPLFVPALQRNFLGLGPYAKFRRRREALDRLAEERINAARTSGEGDDILSLLAASRYDDGAPMATDHILDELRTMLVGGHETTAIALAWAIDALHRNPAIRERLRAALALPLRSSSCASCLRLR